MGRKQNQGCPRIEMKRITKEEDRIITFSKRRAGIYKKASEVSTLCGAQVGVLIFSPAGKAFSFGQPSIEAITDRILHEARSPTDATLNLVEAHRRLRLNELHQEYGEWLSKMEAAKEREKVLRMKKAENRSKGWWEEDMGDLNLHELEEMAAKMESLRMNVQERVNELTQY